MSSLYEFNINIINFKDLGYLKTVANIADKHDRSAPSNYHWKVLKCRMIIFTASSILSCPDKKDVKQIHIIFNRIGNDYDRLISLFLKFSLIQDGNINDVTEEIYLECFHYTLSARIAPTWNVLGCNYYINNRSFLITNGFQDGVQYNLYINNNVITLTVKPIKINIVRPKGKFTPGQKIKVLPSLNEAVIEDFLPTLPKSGDFKCYKDLRRHWKNIHGYRLSEKEFPYYSVRFWRGDPLTYPEICLAENFPIIIPTAKTPGISVVLKFINCLKQNMLYITGVQLLEPISLENNLDSTSNEKLAETQAVSLCTPTQKY